MPLPCVHAANIVEQVPSTIDLLQGMDTLHPDVLTQHGITRFDYHDSLVFRSSIESIRGRYIASSITGRQGMVAAVLESMRGRSIADWRPSHGRQRYDFEVVVSEQPRRLAALEVKGGEGNSINISERPLWADEFILWCHLDGAIVNQPAAGAGAIIFNRVANEMVRRGKHVDAVVFRDAICGSPLRPCPKYPGGSAPGLGVAPDIFLFPQHLPTPANPQPAVHNIATLRLPFLILEAYGVPGSDYVRHTYEVTIRTFQNVQGINRREVSVYHQGRVIETRVARA